MNFTKENDPVKRQEEVSSKDRGTEFSPMSPPEAYNPPCNIKLEYIDFHLCLKNLIDEHLDLKKKMDLFEKSLLKLQKNSSLAFELGEEILIFLNSFQQDFLTHNKKEEKYLFPILTQRFLEIGEHSKGKNPITPIDVLEDEHDGAIHLVTEARLLWNLIPKITEPLAFRILIKEFYVKSLKLVELTRLHIFREDEIVFSLAQKHLTSQELDDISLNFELE
jgi:hemerythrin-like domain-containing protein